MLCNGDKTYFFGFTYAPHIIFLYDHNSFIQSKPVYSNHFFAAKNGKKEPIDRKKSMVINTKCELFTHQ